MSAQPKFIDPLPEVPVLLKSRPNWVRWKLEVVSGKPTKVPYQVNGRKASSTDPSTWMDYHTVVTGAIINHEQGVGFAVSDGIIGVDIDGCYNPKTHKLCEWANPILEELDAYTEISPSGTGIRIWLRGALPAGDRMFKLNPAIGIGSKVQVEIFDRAKYFTVTGNTYYEDAGVVEEHDLTAVYQMLHELREKHPAPSKKGSEGTESASPVQIEKLAQFATNKHDIFMKGAITSREPFIIQNGLGDSNTHHSRKPIWPSAPCSR